MQLWIVSDTHFGHENIIRFCKRPFDSAAEMDDAIMTRWNERVKAQDHVYHLGDVGMSKSSLEMVRLLAGHKRLVMGNHDIFTAQEYLKAGFQKVMAIRVLDRMIFTHIPIHERSMGRFRGNVHGHIHEQPAYGPRYVNVCVEHTGYAPIPIEEVSAMLPKEPNEPRDATQQQ